MPRVMSKAAGRLPTDVEMRYVAALSRYPEGGSTSQVGADLGVTPGAVRYAFNKLETIGHVHRAGHYATTRWFVGSAAARFRRRENWPDLPAPCVGKPSERQETVLEYMKTAGDVSATTVATHLGVANKTASQELKELRRLGYVKHVAYAQWRVLDNAGRRIALELQALHGRLKDLQNEVAELLERIEVAAHA